jgi:hypothetical protein
VRVPLQAPLTAGSYQIVWDLQEAPAILLSQSSLYPWVQTLHVAPQVVPPTPRSTSTPTPVPSNGALFVADTGIPDGTVLRSKQHFAKAWLVFNSGRQAWDSGYTLKRESGSSFGATLVRLPPVPACRALNLVLPMKAPSLSGRYTGTWRLHDAAGHIFGDRLSVVIVVQGTGPSGTPIPTRTPVPTPGGTPPTPTQTPTPTG